MRRLLSCVATAALAATAAQAEDVTIGMITTLSGGGAGLGVDVRDGFMLAMEMAGRDDIHVVIEDDERAPDRAVQLADRMIQAEDVDILDWHHLVEPRHGRCTLGHGTRRVLPLAQCRTLATCRADVPRKLL